MIIKSNWINITKFIIIFFSYLISGILYMIYSYNISFFTFEVSLIFSTISSLYILMV